MDNRKVKLLLTEDISPHKITVLILINAYCHNQIPTNRLRTTLGILSSHIHNDALYTETGELVIVPTLGDFCSSLDRAIRSEENDSNALIADSISLQKLILQTMWGINSVEDLDTCISSFVNSIVEPTTIYKNETSEFKQVSSRSIIGVFIYKVITAFRLLKFDEVFLLFEALVEYREGTRPKYVEYCGGQEADASFENEENHRDPDQGFFATLNQQLEDNLGTNILSSYKQKSHKPDFQKWPLPPSSTRLVPVPKNDLQRLLDRQISLLESYGTATPKALKEIMTLMTSPNSNTCSIQNISFNNLPSYYYIKYLEALNESNYNGAFEALHQYFDYMVSNNSKYFYHFALISRASLHQFFGEDEKAIYSIEEAISVARENKDNSTLTYILSWLFNFIKNKPELWKRQSFYNNNNESQLLTFLMQKSQSVSLSLHSMSYNFATLQIMNKGESMVVGGTGGESMSYFESILKSMYISINDQPSTFIKSSELNSAIWGRVGVPLLSEVYNEISLQTTDNRNDKISIQLRANFLRFARGETEISHQEIEKLKQQVIYTDHALFNSIQVRSLILSIKLNLNKGRFKIAKEIIAILEDNEIKELELKNELLVLRVEIEIGLENYSIALRLISDSLTTDLSDVAMVIKLNLLKCKIYNHSGNFTKGFTLIIQQLETAKRIGFQTLIVEAFLILTSSLNNMEHYKDSRELLEEIMPTIISVGNKDWISEAYFELAKSYFGFYVDDRSSGTFAKVLRFLNLSIVGYKSSVNLVQLMKCFRFESEIAKVQGDESLFEHSNTAIEKLLTRGRDESEYGLVR